MTTLIDVGLNWSVKPL